MPKILRYLITSKVLLSNVRFSASFRRLEESTHCTWIESDAFFNRKLKIKWQGLRSALLAYNLCHHMCSYNTGCGASRKCTISEKVVFEKWNITTNGEANQNKFHKRMTRRSRVMSLWNLFWFAKPWVVIFHFSKTTFSEISFQFFI